MTRLYTAGRRLAERFGLTELDAEWRGDLMLEALMQRDWREAKGKLC